MAYLDADWDSYKDSYRPNTGYVVYFGPNLITWRLRKQPTVSKSSTKAEYCALGYTVDKTIWIQKLLYDLRIVIPHPVWLYCENISAT